MPSAIPANLPSAPPTAASLASAGLQPVVPYDVPAGANVLHVGAGEAFTTLASALAASRDGDVLLVDAGTYTNDFAYVTAKVSIIGVGGMVNLVATTAPANGKAILCVDNDCVIQNLSFSGCAVPDQNGAGIRYEGGSLTLQNCSFHDNENGVMSAPVAGGTLLIRNCDFGHNGNGNGLTHNLYAGGIKQLIIEDSRFHDAVVGHEIKSRATINTIIGNVISDGPDGTASYSIDLPNGGKSVIAGNLIEKGPNAENQSIIHFGGEGIPYAGSSLLVSANQVINDRGAAAVGVLNHTAVPVTITGNSFTRLDSARIAQGPARLSGNVDSPNGDGAGTVIEDAVLSGVLPGNTQVFTDALDHGVTLTASGTAAQGGAGRLTVHAVAGHIIVQGGTGGLDYTEEAWSGGNQISTAAGSSNSITMSGFNLLDSQGTDSIVSGPGNTSGQISGSATIQDGAGNNQWGILGTAHITGHGGAPQLTLSDTGSAVLDGSLAFFKAQSNGGALSYDVQLGGVPVQGSISGGYSMWGSNGFVSIATAAGQDGAALQLGAGQVQVVSQGPDQIRVGSGPTVIQVWSAADIYAGTGQLSVFSRGCSGATLWGAGGTYEIAGDTGGVTYRGGDQASTVKAVLSNITLVGGAGLMTVEAGGRQTIIGGAGGIVVNTNPWSGDDHVTTQAGSTNTVSLNNGTIESWGQDTITQPGGNNTLSIHGTATIQGSPGNSHITVSGHATLASRGGDWVTVQPGATADITAGAYLSAVETGATLRVTVPGAGAPDGTALIQGGGAYVTVDSSRVLGVDTWDAAGTSVTLDGGTSVVWMRSAGQIHAGSGTATLYLCAAGSEVWGGSGSMTVNNYSWTPGNQQTIHGGDGPVSITGCCGDITYIGGAGAASLDGAGRHLVIQGGSGDITVVNAWADDMTFTGGSGKAVLNVGWKGGSITFGTGDTVVNTIEWGAPVAYAIPAGAAGTQVITGFRPGTDSLTLIGAGLAGTDVSGGTTTLLTSSGAHVVLRGVAAPVTPVFQAAPPPDSVPAVVPPLSVPVPADPAPAPSSSSAGSGSLADPAPAVARLATPASSPDAAPDATPPAAPQADPAAALSAALGATINALLAVPASVPVQAQASPQAAVTLPAAAMPVPAATVPAPDIVPPPAAAPAPLADASSAAAAAPAPQSLVAPTAASALPASQAPASQPTASQAAAAASTVPAHAAQAAVSTAETDEVPNPAASSAPDPQPAAPAPQPAFAVVQTATGQADQNMGDAYAGPVSFLQRQFIWTGSSGVAVAASTPDVFLHGGGGDDALAAQGGSNVLDGGAGSNFLVGGTGADGGADTFFLDGRGGQTWSTIVNFHRGDALTLWGFQPGISTAPWTANDGAPGYRGATIHSELGGAGTGITASATFAGLTTDDVQSKLSVTSGTLGGLSYLNVSYTG